MRGAAMDQTEDHSALAKWAASLSSRLMVDIRNGRFFGNVILQDEDTTAVELTFRY